MRALGMLKIIARRGSRGRRPGTRLAVAAVAVAVPVAGILAAGGLSAVPVSAGRISAAGTASGTSLAAAYPATTSGVSLPAVWPTPRQIQAEPGSVIIPPSVGEVVGPGTDPSALSALGAVLRADGVRQVTRVTA